MADIFIGYMQEDKAQAAQMAAALNDRFFELSSTPPGFWQKYMPAVLVLSAPIMLAIEAWGRLAY